MSDRVPAVTDNSAVKNPSVLAAVVLTVASIVGFIVMTVIGGEAAENRTIFLFSTPVIAALLTAPIVRDVQTIKRQTNGLHDEQVEKVATVAATRAAGYVGGSVQDLVQKALEAEPTTINEKAN